MAHRTFVDSNVWVYAVDRGEIAKQSVALEFLRPKGDADYVISAQVLSEFFTVVRRKFAREVPFDKARALVAHMSRLPVVPIDASLVQAAISGSAQWQLSYWDSLIVAAAHVAGCGTILSEDMGDGPTYGEVRVVNPFTVGSDVAR